MIYFPTWNELIIKNLKKKIAEGVDMETLVKVLVWLGRTEDDAKGLVAAAKIQMI